MHPEFYVIEFTNDEGDYTRRMRTTKKGKEDFFVGLTSDQAKEGTKATYINGILTTEVWEKEN
mgnify:CR=1 FL=1